MTNIYRGYDIEHDAKHNHWLVSLNGDLRARCDSEDAAMNFVDADRRKAAKATAGSN